MLARKSVGCGIVVGFEKCKVGGGCVSRFLYLSNTLFLKHAAVVFICIVLATRQCVAWASILITQKHCQKEEKKQNVATYYLLEQHMYVPLVNMHPRGCEGPQLIAV